MRVMALTEKERGLVRSLREEGVRRLSREEALKNEEESDGGDERDKDAIVCLRKFNSIQFYNPISSHLICVWLVC